MKPELYSLFFHHDGKTLRRSRFAESNADADGFIPPCKNDASLSATLALDQPAEQQPGSGIHASTVPAFHIWV